MCARTAERFAVVSVCCEALLDVTPLLAVVCAHVTHGRRAYASGIPRVRVRVSCFSNAACVPPYACLITHASLLLQPLYSDSLGGFILSPEAGAMLCAYFADGSTQNAGASCIKGLDPLVTEPSPDCVPGCSRNGLPPSWCHELIDYGGCAWPPSSLERMMVQQLEVGNGGYNEVVFGTPPDNRPPLPRICVCRRRPHTASFTFSLVCD